MKLVSKLAPLSPFPSPRGLTIGNFDGVHLGHKHLINHLRRQVGLNGTIAVITFSNHPTEIFPNRPTTPLITSPTLKARYLEECGVDLVFLLPFTEELASLSYRAFLHAIRLIYPFTHLTLGIDARFGHKQQGTPDAIRALAQEEGFVADYIEKIPSPLGTLSSGAIRTLLERGDISKANALLGRPHQIDGHFNPDGQFTPSHPSLCRLPSGEYPCLINQEEGTILVQNGEIRSSLSPLPPEDHVTLTLGRH